jgi:hypothetical protein
MRAAPSPRGRAHARQLRRRVAIEAARLISEGGLRDYQAAKRKAAMSLGVTGEANVPDNGEVEEALREHQRLFQSASQPRHLRRLREAACEALRFFDRWQPLLVGAVQDGSADQHSAVCLHLFGDDPGEIVRFLDNHAIPCRELQRRLRFSHHATAEFPAFTFSADGIPVDVTVLPCAQRHQAPLDRRGERPMQRLTLAALETLLGEQDDGEREPREPG